MTASSGNPIKKEDVAKSEDQSIDKDFPGFPYAQSKENIINPGSSADKKTAAVNIKDGEKMDDDEQRSDGSGGAFAATEEVSK